MPTATQTSSAFGMPSTLWPVAMKRIAGDDESWGEKPPVCTTISPCATALTASVTTIDGRRRMATPRPLTSPRATPQPTPMGMASAAPTLPQPVAAVAIMPPTATTHGTDRSICPSRITIIAPVAITPRNDATFNCCRRYSGDRKLLECRLPTTSTTAMQAKGHRIVRSMRCVNARTRRPRTPPPRRASARASSIELEPVAHAQQPKRAERYRSDQHDALEQRLPQRLDVEHEQDRKSTRLNSSH